MNRLVHQQKTADPQPAKPHMVRRAIRYRAADNARQAIQRQYPGIFVPQNAALEGQVGHA